MNKDTNLIFEAYKKRLNEAVDLDYLPSLEDIKKELTNLYNNHKRFYSPEVYKNKINSIDSTANEIHKLLVGHKEWVEKYNSELNPDDKFRSKYTLWSSVYSELSDYSKELNGFRHRTSPEETPLIPLTLNLLDIHKDIEKKYEHEKAEEARPKSHAENLYSSDPQKVDEQIVNLINDNSNLSVQSLATKIDKEVIKSEEFGKVEGPHGEESMEKYNIHNVISVIKHRKDINLDPTEKEALIKEIQGMYKTK